MSESPTTFSQYLQAKKIGESAFSQGQPEQFSHMATLFLEMGPASFTQRYRFHLNALRRQFPLSTH